MGFLTSRLTVIAGMAVVALLALAVISRNWGCKKPPKPPVLREFEAVVAEVPNGATVGFKDGPRGRRVTDVHLADVAAPTDDEPLAAKSRENLARLAGKKIRVQTERRRLVGSDGEDNCHDVICSDCKGTGRCKPPDIWIKHHPKDDREMECAMCGGGTREFIEYPVGAPMDAIGHLNGIVFGETGENLCLAQLRDGLVRNTGKRPEWIAAEKEARKARVGLWK